MTLNTINEDSLKNFSEIQNKEVLIKLKNNEIIDGIVRGLKDEVLIISRNGEWQNKINVCINDVESLNFSKHPYFTMEHKRDLREGKIPRYEFRYNEEKLKCLLDNYVFVNYDGKLIDGKITKVNYSNKQSSLVIESQNINKEIMCYQLRDLEITGKNEGEHNGKIKLKELECSIYEKIDKIVKGDKNALKNKIINPDDLLDEYFKSKIIRNEEVCFDYSWILEVAEEGVLTKEGFYNNQTMRNVSNNIKKAKVVNEYYNSRIELINYIIKEVNKIDWIKYSKTQSKGVNEALEYFYNIEIIRTA